MSAEIQMILELALRIVVGGTFVMAAVGKLVDLKAFELGVMGYGVTPWVARFVSRIVPASEIVLGGALRLGALLLAPYGLGRGLGLATSGLMSNVRPVDSVMAGFASLYVRARAVNTGALALSAGCCLSLLT